MPLEANLKPGQPWVFDKEVADHFPSMLNRSVPGLGQCRALVNDMLQQVVWPKGTVLELGCGTGLGMRAMQRVLPDANIIGLDNSDDMLERAEFDGTPNMAFVKRDLSLEGFSFSKLEAVVSVLTLQFIPKHRRGSLIREIYLSLEEGATFILVEKVEPKAGFREVIRKSHHVFKLQQGYTEAEIRAKDEALQDVMVPVSVAQNEAWLLQAGFSLFDRFWQHGPFVGWVAKK